MVTAEDFAGPRIKNGPCLGVDRFRAAAALRHLADEIEAGQVTLAKVKKSDVASPREFCVTRLVLTMYERGPAEPQEK